MSDDPISKVYCVGNSKAIIRARWDNLYTFELEYPRFIHCYDEETEILAIVGNDAPKFMSFTKAKALGAKVAQYHETSKTISFVEPIEWHEQTGIHRMVNFEQNKLSLSVTDGHRMLVDKRTSRNRFLPTTWTADKFLGDYICCRIRQSGIYEQNQKYSKEELALMVWFACDGTKQGNKICFHFKKQRKIDAVIRLLTTLKIEHTVSTYEDNTCIRCLAPAWIEDCYTESHEKKLPEQGMFMNQESYTFVKKAILESDGSVTNMDFNSTSKELAEQVQVLAHLHGDSMNLCSYGQGRTKQLYKSCFKDNPYISLRRDKDKFSEEKKVCTVYCVTVPSSYVMVRRHGIVFIAGNCELMTHRMFSRSASSSRAVPVERTIQNILNDPWVPSDVYKNCKGMQGKDIVNEDDYDIFCEEWQDAAFKAIEVAHKMIDNGFHKQHINRILEPFTKIKVIVTATEWDNFFKLRLSPDADPEIQHLAKAIKMAMNAVSNTYVYINAHGGRTLPYVNFDELDAIDDLRILTLISAARCARVSYLNHDGSKPDILKDLALAKRLINSGHMTPFEHQCRYSFDTGFQYNLRDFQSARYMLDHGIDLSAP